MDNIEYKKYSKRKMLKIIKKGFLFVETNLGDNYIIRKKDLVDFIILETERTGHYIKMKFYMPGIDKPVITTMGWFLDKANPLLRKEIIHRLIVLQTTEKRPRKIKVFNNDIFFNMSKKELGIIGNEVKNFDKLYLRYANAQKGVN